MTKQRKWHVRPSKTQISLGIRPVWSESLLSAWRKLGSLATQWAHREGSDQTGWMPRLIWVFAGRTVILLLLSCHGSCSFVILQTDWWYISINSQVVHFSLLSCYSQICMRGTLQRSKLCLIFSAHVVNCLLHENRSPSQIFLMIKKLLKM